jgi:methylated-DNA-[protein]-cysteine S-methyltransferase
MRYSSRVVTFATRVGKCRLRVVAGEAGLERLDLDPEDEAPDARDDEQPLVREALRQLGAYFEGRLFDFDLPLDLRGTAFQRLVWKALVEIPYGETRSYGDIARFIGHPTAVRGWGRPTDRIPWRSSYRATASSARTASWWDSAADCR